MFYEVQLQHVYSWGIVTILICAVFFQDFILEINELRYRITELENEKLQHEKKLKSTKVSFDENIIYQTVNMSTHSLLFLS